MNQPSPTVVTAYHDFSASAQDRLRIPQETELKAAYISLVPNDEHPHPDNGSVEELSALMPVTQACHVWTGPPK